MTHPTGAAGSPDTGDRRAVPIEHRARFGGGAVAPFGQMLTVGLMVCAFSLPIITAVPALAGGVRHLEQHLSARADSLADLVRSIWEAIRSGWWVGVLTAFLVGLLALNVSMGMQNLVPGGTFFAVVSGILALVLVVVAVRSAALWEPGARWGDLLRRGRDLTVEDPIGSLIVVAALAVCGVIVWMLAPLIVITPGMLAIALVAVERRRAQRASR